MTFNDELKIYKVKCSACGGDGKGFITFNVGIPPKYLNIGQNDDGKDGKLQTNCYKCNGNGHIDVDWIEYIKTPKSLKIGGF